MNAIHAHARRGNKTPTYFCWMNMRRRCSDPKVARYPRYGGRGIVVCASWDASFGAFLADMGEKPVGMTLDRTDNDGNYEPSNCRWATRTEQQRNTSRSKLITHDGVTMTQRQWSLRVFGDPFLLGHRIRSGWTEHAALVTPLFPCGKKKSKR